MFQPVIPLPGLAGWQFLQKTYDTQFEAFTQSISIKRDTEYFKENISQVSSGKELVSDRRLLTVALGAFGLQDDINNKFFIQRMLDDGTTNDDALANKFIDQRYKELSEAFGFGPNEIPRNLVPGFADDIIQKFERQSFEVSVGNQDQTMRIALTADREFAKLSPNDGTERQNWFLIMGKPALRELFETAFNLPSSMAQIDIDQQVDIFSEKASQIFGIKNPAEFDGAELKDELLSRYTALAQIKEFNSGFSSGQIALSLLSN